MAERISLRDYQRDLAARLKAADSGRTSSKLAVQAGAEGWLVDLMEAGEVIPVPPITAVAQTRPWFKGVSNVRGNLYSVIDFSAFQGADTISPGMERRVILVGERLVAGSGLLVSRMLGLRNPEQFTPAERPAEARPWVGGVYTDAGGTRWMELDLPALVREPRFLEVGA
jgi:twitching motility protein PilI